MSKGSAPRPFSVSQDQFSTNWDNIFGKNKTNKQVEKSEQTCYNTEQSTNQKVDTNERTLDGKV